MSEPEKAPGVPDRNSPEALIRRGIFAYERDGRTVLGDPGVILTRMYRAISGDLDELLAAAFAEPVEGEGDAAANKAAVDYLNSVDALMPAIREGFGVAPFDEADGTGLTTTEAMALLAEFLRFQELHRLAAASAARAESEAKARAEARAAEEERASHIARDRARAEDRERAQSPGAYDYVG